MAKLFHACSRLLANFEPRKGDQKYQPLPPSEVAHVFFPPQKYSKDQRVPTQPTPQVPLGKSHPKGERMWLINGTAQFCPNLNF